MRQVGPTVRFDTTQNVQEFVVLSENSSFHKQSHRGTNNPWRRYGALQKLHQIGGFAPQTNGKSDRKNRDFLGPIKKGSKPPQPPSCPQMKVNRIGGKKNTKGEIDVKFKLPRGANASEMCLMMAEQIQVCTPILTEFGLFEHQYSCIFRVKPKKKKKH